MKLIHFPQELLTLLIAFTVSTCAFANNHEETDPDWNWVHDFVVDNYAYDIVPSSSNSIPCVVLIEAHGHSGHIDIPAYVTHNDTTYQVSTLGVGGPVFRECRDLTSVYIPKEIMMINNNPFVGCSNLANISVDPENKYYDSRSLCHALVTSPQNPYKEPNMLVAACKNTTIPNDVEVIGTEAFYQCHYLTQINIPNSVTTIKRSAFNGCERLSTLVIGEGVRTIEGYAFFKCAALKTVMCLAETPPFLDNCVFKNTPVDALDEVYEIALQLPVYVPDQSVDMYKSKWPWSNFNIQPLSKANSLAYKSQWCDSWTTFFKDEEANTDETTWLYRLGPDTIIDQQTYTIVNRYSTMQGVEATEEYVAAVRFTDDKKVYIFYDNAEYLLYDFNVQEGDKIEVFAGINNYSEFNKTFRCVVQDVNIDPNTNLSEIQLYVHPNNMTAQINKTKWIEGIGDTLGFMMLNGFKYPRKTTSSLVCATKNKQFLYMMSESEMEKLNTSCYCNFHFEDNAKEGKFGGRPTPTQWNLLEELQRERISLRPVQAMPTQSTLTAETYVYELYTDTLVINNKPYQQLVRYSTKDDASATENIGWLHFSDDNKVLFLYDDKEFLLYDFDAAIGDTLNIFAGINNYPHQTSIPHVLTQKDTLSDGRAILTLKAILFEEQNEQFVEKSLKKVWMAGLGSLDGIVHNNITTAEDYQITMLCAWLEDECIYTTDHPLYKSLGCVYNSSSTTTIENIQPTTPSYQKFLRDGQLIIIHEGKTYNVMGVEVRE